MKLVRAAFCLAMSVVYMLIGVHVLDIWPGQPIAHSQFQELVYAFGSGLLFCMGLFDFISFVKENR